MTIKLRVLNCLNVGLLTTRPNITRLVRLTHLGLTEPFTNANQFHGQNLYISQHQNASTISSGFWNTHETPAIFQARKSLIRSQFYRNVLYDIRPRLCWYCQCKINPAGTRRRHDVDASLWYRCYVLTSHRRQFDIISTLCARWECVFRWIEAKRIGQK